uniref:Uncharacterized protein n=1 Tax=Acrobeloides nanus TaxID=290746 RepID=A0A914E236_9BILA
MLGFADHRDYRAAFKRQLSFLPWCRNAVNVKQQTQAISRVQSSVKTMNQIRLRNNNKSRTIGIVKY